MPAGESAWREAERRRLAAQRHASKAESLRRQAQAFAKGAAGEAATSLVLDRLVSEGWLRVEDRRWPDRVRANIDHIVVGPGGVFVIDSKNWAATPRVHQGILYAGGHRREREVAAAADAAIAVAALLPARHRGRVVPVICFVSDQPVAGVSRGVLVCATANVEMMLRTRPACLSVDDVEDVASELVARTEPALSRPAVRHARAPRRTSRAAVGRRVQRRRGKISRRDLVSVLLLLVLATLFLSGAIQDLIRSAGAWYGDRIVDAVTDVGE